MRSSMKINLTRYSASNALNAGSRRKTPGLLADVIMRTSRSVACAREGRFPGARNDGSDIRANSSMYRSPQITVRSFTFGLSVASILLVSSHATACDNPFEYDHDAGRPLGFPRARMIEMLWSWLPDRRAV